MKGLLAKYRTKKLLSKCIGRPLRLHDRPRLVFRDLMNGRLIVYGPSLNCKEWVAIVTVKQGLIEKVI